MNRREYLITSAGTVSLAGCTQSLEQVDQYEEVEWDGDFSVWIQPSGQNLALIVGEIYNVGDVDIDRVELEASILDHDGSQIDNRSRIVRGLVEGTRQQYFFRFYLDKKELDRIDDFNIEGELID